MIQRDDLSIRGEPTDAETAAIVAALDTVLNVDVPEDHDSDSPMSDSQWRFAARLDGIGDQLDRRPRSRSSPRWRRAARLTGSR